MSLNSIVDQLKKLSADKRIHFVVQSLNGFEVHKPLLNEVSLEICNIFEKDLKFLKDKCILKNDYIVLLTIPEILTSEEMSFQDVELFGLDHKFKILETCEHKNNIINLFKIE
jgi:hypothetical protein